MAQIIIKNLYNKVIVVSNNSQTVLDSIHEHYIDWMHSCGKKGNCTTCKMLILEGAENLSQPSRNEMNFMKLKRLSSNERLACQCFVNGDIIVEVPAIYKLPHVQYSY